MLSREQLEKIIRRDLENICCIYRTIGAAFFQEAEDRLVQKIAHSIYKAQNSKDILNRLERAVKGERQ